MTLTDVNTRRAIFVYEAARLAAETADAPIVPEPWADREIEFQDQFLDVIFKQCSDARELNPEILHQQWVDKYLEMGWVYGEFRDPVKKTHPDMVPYDQLEQRERDKDSVFVALCEIARQWIN